MTRTLLLTAVLLLFNAGISSCKKDAAPPPEKPLQVEEITTVNDNIKPGVIIPTDKTLKPTRSIFNFEFNWETAQYMPSSPGTPRVPVPWSDNVIRNYDPALRYDFKKADGWEMVYNTYSDTINFATKHFMLYNKYRGVLRSYSYNAQRMNADLLRSRWLFNDLSIESSSFSTPLLNFAGQHIVDMDADTRQISVIEPWRLDQDSWVVTEFEMAYDENIGNKPSYPYSSFTWELVFSDMTEQSINETPSLDKPIYLQIPGVYFKNLSLYGKPISSKVLIREKSANSMAALSGLLPASVVTELQQSISANEPGKLLNASLTPSLGLADCKLEVDATMQLGFNQFLFTSPSFALPGMDNSHVIGGGPYFNEPMGIFYLKEKPLIRRTQISGVLPEQYELDVPSVKYLLNPFVQSYADIRNFKQEIVAIDTKEMKPLSEAKIYRGQILKASALMNILGVRVSFDVVPKNGSGATTIIKTFKADVQG